MKKIFGLILILFLAFSQLKADAVVMSDTEVKNIIAKQVLENYKNYTDAQLSVEVITLPFKELHLPDGQISFTVASSYNKFMARDLEKVSVYVNNRLVKTFNAPVTVKAWENVLVASSFINIGQTITPKVVTIKKMEVSNILQHPLKAEALTNDIRAKKAFREGEIIDKRFVKLKPEIVRNSNVTVFFYIDNLTISVEATALSDGMTGDNICLINKHYNKVYTGKVIGENKVLVKL